MKILLGEINNKKIFKLFTFNYLDEILLEKHGEVLYNLDADKFLKIVKILRIDELNLNNYKNQNKAELFKFGYSNGIHNELSNLNIEEGDKIKLAVLDFKIPLNQEEKLIHLIENPLNESDFYSENYSVVYHDKDKHVRIVFQEYTVPGRYNKSVMAHLELTAAIYYGYDDAESYLSFDIYSNQMIDLDKVITSDGDSICFEEVIEIVKSISKITKKKYTFHKEGIPCFTIMEDTVIFCQEN